MDLGKVQVEGITNRGRSPGAVRGASRLSPLSARSGLSCGTSGSVSALSNDQAPPVCFALQIAAFLGSRVACPSCGRARGIKDHKSLTFRTLFGKLVLARPRLRACPCAPQGQASFSPLLELLPERTAPELGYLESRWASLVSYGLTVKALRDFLPVDAALNPTSVRRDTLRVARRLEAELGPEPVFPLAGCPGDCASLPPPPEPITVGLDGGYLRHWGVMPRSS